MTPRRAQALVWLAQRASAAVLALCVVVHLATMIVAVRGGLTAGEILARTRGSVGWAAFYAVFVVAVAVHAPIGLRTVAGRMGWACADAAPTSRSRPSRSCCWRSARAPSTRSRWHRDRRPGERPWRLSRTRASGLVGVRRARRLGLALALFLPLHFWVLGSALQGAAALDGFLSWTGSRSSSSPRRCSCSRWRCTSAAACGCCSSSSSAGAPTRRRPPSRRRRAFALAAALLFALNAA